MASLRGLLIPFRVMVILNSGSVDSAWGTDAWRRAVEECFSPLTDLWESRPSVHVRALDKEGRAVRLGQVSFSSDAAERWSSVEVNGGFIEDIQVFYPPRDALLEGGSLPHVYFSIGSFVEPLGNRAMRYNQFQVVISDPSRREAKTGVVQRLENCLLSGRGVVAAFLTRIRILSLNQVESVITEYFVYPGILRGDLPEESRMKGAWKRVELPHRCQA